MPSEPKYTFSAQNILQDKVGEVKKNTVPLCIGNNKIVASLAKAEWKKASD